MSGGESDRKQRIRELRQQLDRLEKRFQEGTPAPREALARDLRRTLKNQSVTATQAATRKDPIVYPRNLKAAAQSLSTPVPGLGTHAYRVDLEETLSHGREVRTSHGVLFELLQSVRAIEDAEKLDNDFSDALSEPGSPLCRCLDKACELTDLAPSDFIFMDIETTGLSSSPLFLIGVMVWTDGGFEVQQFFARTYAEEAAVVQRFIEACSHRRMLVTFNGKSFDYPYIRTRAAAHRIAFELKLAHLDLLHESRRHWKDSLPNCKLQTLETHICNRRRTGDIPGGEIPDAYHNYVRSNDAWQMVDALKHNLLDLVTLADIMTRLPE